MKISDLVEVLHTAEMMFAEQGQTVLAADFAKLREAFAAAPPNLRALAAVEKIVAARTKQCTAEIKQ